MRVWAARPLVCRDAVSIMSDFVDGRLPRREANRLERHLADCPHCHEHLEQLRLTIRTLGHAEPEALTETALDDLIEVYQRWRAEESAGM
ncbi:MAG: zf-HC2 domain-containing protein [Frankiaceae bacterium]|nr:zf-HC2 domain-containing protein [Frankiaceae bacterium]MBV9872657.1 zf-HC2 domain-containing protein [Frankiaceae bacterium]